MILFNIFIIIISTYFTCCKGGNSNLWWRDINIGDVLEDLVSLTTVGYEKDATVTDDGPKQYFPVYLCRGRSNNSWIPGKLIFRIMHDGNIYCSFAGPGNDTTYIAFDNEEAKNIQLLTVPIQFTSWVSAKSEYLDRFVDAGDGSVICRARDERLLHVGEFKQDEGACIYSYYGFKKADNNIELLVYNMFGLKTE